MSSRVSRTRVDEIVDGVYRIATFDAVPGVGAPQA